MSESRDNSSLHVGSSSKSLSRPGSRNASCVSVPYLPLGPEELINPDAPIGEEVAELLQEFVHSHRHDTEQTLVYEADEEGAPADNVSVNKQPILPWWRRPSPWWFIILIPINSMAHGATMAPRVSVYTRLVCDAYKPEYTRIGWDNGNYTLQSACVRSVFSAIPTDDNRWALCASDPAVQAAVAKLSLAMTASMGILACLTTAWWGSMSDRYGRVILTGISSIGVLVTELIILLVYNFPHVFPGGFWFLLVGPIVDGFLGGVGSVSSAIHAYMADCTDVGARSRIFSLYMGLLFSGMSIGPTLGSLTISFTGDIMSVFYITFCLHITFCLLLWLIIPESLTISQREEARRLHAGERAITRSRGGILTRLSEPFGFLRALMIFYPTIIEDRPNKMRKDWSLLLVIATYGCTVSLVGGVSYKMQYMSAVFGWTAKEIGYWSSSVGAVRAMHLTLLLPVIIRLCQPRSPAIQLPTAPSEPLDSDTGSPPTARSSAPSARMPESLEFDLVLARRSVLIEISSYVLMAYATSGGFFAIFSVMSSLGMGYGPAIGSLASALYDMRGGKEMGKLFGAMSVVQMLSSQVLGPTIFACTYMATVATFPPAIFLVSAGVLFGAFLLLFSVRLPKVDLISAEVDVENRPASDPVSLEGTAVDVEEVLVVVEEEDQGQKVAKP